MAQHRALRPLAAILWLGLALALCLSAPVRAQAANEEADGPAAVTASGGSSAPLSAQDKAAYIRQLMEGKLDAGISADRLFAWSLRYRDVARANVVEQLVEDDAFYARASQDAAQIETLRPQEARLALAQAAFLRLPATRRKALLRTQAERNAKAAQVASQASDEERALAALQSQIASLESFLKGDPDPNGDAVRFWIEGAEPDGLGTLIRKAAQASGESGAQVQAAVRKRDDLLARVLALPDTELQALEDRRRLMQQSGQEIAAAENSLRDATTAREQAQFAARNASSASARLTAAERARLLAVQQKQAAYRSELAKSSDEPSQILDAALKWRARVSEIARAEGGRDQREARADALYREIVAQLKTVRSSLSQELSQRTSSGFADAMPGPLDPAITDSLPGARQLQALRERLVVQAGELGALLGGYFIQGQHFVQIELFDQAWNQLFGAALQYQQAGAALAQFAVEGCQAFHQKARAVHAQATAAQRARLQLCRVEDIERHDTVSIQGGLYGRVVVEAQILFEPEQHAAHGVILVEHVITIRCCDRSAWPFVPGGRPRVR